MTVEQKKKPSSAFDDVVAGTMVWLSRVRGRDVPCTILDVFREDDGVVSEVLAQREDTGEVFRAAEAFAVAGRCFWRTRHRSSVVDDGDAVQSARCELRTGPAPSEAPAAA